MKTRKNKQTKTEKIAVQSQIQKSTWTRLPILHHNSFLRRSYKGIMITQNSHEEALTHRGCGDGPPPKVTSVLSRRANLEAHMGADAGLGEDRVLGTQSDPDSELDTAAPAPWPGVFAAVWVQQQRTLSSGPTGPQKPCPLQSHPQARPQSDVTTLHPAGSCREPSCLQLNR